MWSTESAKQGSETEAAIMEPAWVCLKSLTYMVVRLVDFVVWNS